MKLSEYKSLKLGVASAAVLASLTLWSLPAASQGDSSQPSVFAPDPSVFEQLTDLQRQISILEREVVLEDLKLRRRELDLEMEELERRNLDREIERERVQREEQAENERERLEREREEAIRIAEEDLQISRLRAEREAVLRSLELATQQEEAAAAEAAADEATEESEAEDSDSVLVVPSNQVRRRVTSASPQPSNLIVAPGGSPEPASGSQFASADFNADLGALANMLGVQTPVAPQPAPETVAVEPEPEPEPVPPVVRRVRGAGGNISATLVLLGGGQVEVVEGADVPGGWSIVSITPSQVEAVHEDDEEPVRLAFGTRVVDTNAQAPSFVAVAETPPPQPVQPGLDGGFNPIGQGGSFPIPGGFSGF